MSNKNDETATSAQQKNAKENDKSSATKPEPTKAVKKDAAQDAANKSGGGWFGGIFKWKAKNQMILPDDKNPAVKISAHFLRSRNFMNLLFYF